MEFYYVLSKDKRTATCYYDYRREERGGILPWGNSHYVFGLFRRLFGLRYSLKKVVFDATCKSASFASTTEWFSGCSSLEEITGLENLNTSKVKDMHAMFCGCHVLSALDLSSFDTTQVTNMSLMFCGCRALSALDLSSFDTTQVTNMSSMFRGCSALTALDLSSFNTTSVGGMMSMFQGCKSLKALDLSSFNGRAVVNMENMFADCPALTHLDLSYFYPKKVKVLKGMFFNCRELTTIYCKATWDCRSSEGMFEECRKLRGAVPYDFTRTDVEMANPDTGYFSSEEPNLPVPEKKPETAPEKKENPANNEEEMTPNEFVNCSFFTMQGVPIEGGVADLPAGMYLMKKD
jgi:hypothetical protein